MNYINSLCDSFRVSDNDCENSGSDNDCENSGSDNIRSSVHLAPDMISEIVEYTTRNPVELIKLSHVNTQFYHVCNQPRIWRMMQEDHLISLFYRHKQTDKKLVGRYESKDEYVQVVNSLRRSAFRSKLSANVRNMMDYFFADRIAACTINVAWISILLCLSLIMLQPGELIFSEENMALQVWFLVIVFVVVSVECISFCATVIKNLLGPKHLQVKWNFLGSSWIYSTFYLCARVALRLVEWINNHETVVEESRFSNLHMFESVYLKYWMVNRYVSQQRIVISVLHLWNWNIISLSCVCILFGMFVFRTIYLYQLGTFHLWRNISYSRFFEDQFLRFFGCLAWFCWMLVFFFRFFLGTFVGITFVPVFLLHVLSLIWSLTVVCSKGHIVQIRIPNQSHWHIILYYCGFVIIELGFMTGFLRSVLITPILLAHFLYMLNANSREVLCRYFDLLD